MGACFEVYREKGCGFLEGVYQECLRMELTLQTIPFSEKQCLRLSYKGTALEQTYEPDFICFDKIILEIKAVSTLMDSHRAQVHNYLKATGHKLGLLVNFGHYPKLEYERIVDGNGFDHETHEIRKKGSGVQGCGINARIDLSWMRGGVWPRVIWPVRMTLIGVLPRAWRSLRAGALLSSR